MPNMTVPVMLDKGLDTVTHPVTAEPGTLIDCLNYEMTDDAGYHRIDGFEPYDGWIAGDIADYYHLHVTITDPAIVASLTPGRMLSLVDTAPSAPEKALGTIVEYDPATQAITYAPANKDAPMIAPGTLLDIELNSVSRMTANVCHKGSIEDTPDIWLAKMRNYTQLLRNLVVHMTTPVAGVHWFRNTLVVARDCYTLTYNDSSSTSRDWVQVGSFLGYLTTRYRVVARSVSGTLMTLALERFSSQTNTPNITVYSQNLGGVPLHTVVTASNISLTTGPNDNAYLVSLNTPEIWNERGRVLLSRSVHLRFSGGVALAEGNFVPNSLITVGSGGGADYLTASIKSVEITSGSFAANDAAGWIEIVPDWTLSSGNFNNITTAHDLMVSGITKLADIEQIVWSTIPGTKKLQSVGTRYQWITANFYGQENTTEMYGATGASRGFWAQAYRPYTTRGTPPGGAILITTLETAWGNIMTDRTYPDLDIPKYVAYHGGCLAFGVAGSVVRSIGGEPYIFSGVLGATEIATGDNITGLLEAQDDSLIVFGRRSIRRLTGYTTDDLSLKTVGGDGCFDYTACMVGATPVFTGPSGISTLEQSEKYGSFQGSRISASVSNTLVPKLITDWSDSEPGGAVMALPVRAKNQYRLWLRTGEVYSVCFTSKGPKVTVSNYGFDDDVRVPLAWTSQLTDAGKERIFVTFDDVLSSSNISVTGHVGTLPNPRHIFELDRGWGFSGRTFRHYFDVTHLFGDSQAIQITGVRLHGWGYGLASLDIKSSGIEDGYEQDFHTQLQDISLPRTLSAISMNMRPLTSIVDQANWGLGVKLRVNGTQEENLTTTEPSHVCQVLVLQVNPTGAKDN